ncbi:MAG: alpha/beta hydrolase [Rhizobiales bacterium]|nr:alpha/beta hydrolase [Hyphomicrobiales bacterium]
MHTLIVIAVVLALGALVTAIGSWLIGRAHPPRGRFINVRRLRQHVVELGTAAGDTPPIVLIHGAGVNLEDMRLALGERLAARHRVILIDRPGLGWSKRRGRDGSALQVQAAMLREVLDQLGVARAMIVGHSWGGAVATSFALDYPDRTAALILLASPFYPHAHPMLSLYALFATPIIGWIYARTLALPLSLPFVGLALGSAFLPQLPPRDYRKRSAALLLLRPSTFLANARDMADLKRNLEPQPARYPGLAMPTLVMAGTADFVVGPQLHAVRFAAAVPHAKLVILPGIGHMLHHASTERVVAEIEGVAAMMVPPRLAGERGV